MIPIERLLKELRGKLKSLPDTEKDVENINSFLLAMEVCPARTGLENIIDEFRKSSEINKVKRRDVLKILSDNYFYFPLNIKKMLKNGKHNNCSDKELIKLITDLNKKVKQ